MFSKFLSLDVEKQERILNAAIAEFAKKGYDKASTNEIVKEANISKGILFHYFKSKKDLFIFAYDHFADIITEEFFKKIDLKERDFLIKFRQIMLCKFQLIKKYPEVFNFLMAANIEEASDFKNALDRCNNERITKSYQQLFNDIDYSKFKEEIDIPRVMNIIMWTFEGFRNQQVEKAKSLNIAEIDYEEAFAEMDVYIELLKKTFYK